MEYTWQWSCSEHFSSTSSHCIHYNAASQSHKNTHTQTDRHRQTERQTARQWLNHTTVSSKHVNHASRCTDNHFGSTFQLGNLFRNTSSTIDADDMKVESPREFTTLTTDLHRQLTSRRQYDSYTHTQTYSQHDSYTHTQTHCDIPLPHSGTHLHINSTSSSSSKPPQDYGYG